MDDNSSDNEEGAERGVRDEACDYGRAGISVFPVHYAPGAQDDKAPMPGYLWQDRATDRVQYIVEDFEDAIRLWGEANVSIAWALGQDGYMAIDLDQPDDPEWWHAVDYAGITNVTKRGVHLIFKNPPGIEPSNSTAQFPTRGWGDVRGTGGYIVIAGPDRPGFDAEQLGQAQPFPRPEWLTEYGGGATAVSMQSVMDFANAHNTSSDIAAERHKLNGIVGMVDRFMESWKGESGGRHDYCQWMLAAVAEESGKGYYPFKAGVQITREWWKTVMAKEPQRWDREFEGMLRWAVGKAQGKAPLPTVEPDTGEAPDLFADDNTDPIAHIEMVDWTALWSAERAPEEWIVDQLWPRGRSILLHAPAKEGKSELALYCVACLALGVDPWTRQSIEPIRVLYLDYEMTENDLLDRLQDFGVTPDDDLSNLRYALLPLIAPLDTQRGANELAALVARERPDCVVIDTFGRAVEGEENDADTVRDFFRLTGVTLKRAGVPYARTDHTGKDRARGVRGSSAKNDDVDIVWSMERSARGTKLTSKSRVSWVPKTLELERVFDPALRYHPPIDIAGMVPDAGVTAKVYELEELAIPVEWGRDRVRVALLDAGRQPGDNNTLAKAITYRRDAARRGAVIAKPSGLRLVADSGPVNLSADRSEDEVGDDTE
jgi:hypothetical protein